MNLWGALALVYHLTSRLAYVVWVGWALRRERRINHYAHTYGAEAGFRRFRRVAATLMNNDGVSFVVLCLLTRGTLPIAAPWWLLVGIGAALAAVGIGVKLWARAATGSNRYYWHDFFSGPAAPLEPAAGPYRYLKNPMYTVGNLHLWGLALGVASLPGLGAALFDHVAILVFNHVVERPHVKRHYRAAVQREGSPVSSGAGHHRAE
jgi:protein-S-isoprenylcysteine O-methyltransferase Ste14